MTDAEVWSRRNSLSKNTVHHHVFGPYLLRYSQEASFREDANRVDNGAQVCRVAELALKRGPSVDFAGYNCIIWISTLNHAWGMVLTI